MKISSMRGEMVDFTKYLAENEDAVAIGNARMNARGDLLGPGGTVMKKREDIAAEYHRANPNAVRKVSIKDLSSEVFQTPAETVKQLTEQRKAANEAAAAAAAKAEPAATADAKKRKLSDD